MPIEDAGLPLRRNPLLWAVLAAWCGLVSIPVSMVSGPTALLVTAGGRAARRGGRRGGPDALAGPAVRASFNAQVIARWLEDHDNGEAHSVLPHIAVDDGQQAWSAEAGPGPFSRLQVGDVIRVQAAPRSRRLVGLEPASPGGQARYGQAGTGRPGTGKRRRARWRAESGGGRRRACC